MRADTLTVKLLLIVFCLMLLWSFSVPASAAEAKFAKINLGEIYRNSKKLKDAAEDLKKMQLDLEVKLVPMKDTVAKLHEQLKSGENTLKKEEKEKLEAELKEKAQELEHEQQAIRVKTGFRQKSIQNAFMGQLREAIKKIGDQEGLTAIFSSDLLLYAEGVPDQTQQVLTELEAMPAMDLGRK